MTTQVAVCTCKCPSGFTHVNNDYYTNTQTWIHVKCGGIVTRPLYPQIPLHTQKATTY